MVFFDVVGLNSILFLSGIEVEKGLIVEVGVDFVDLFFEFGDDFLGGDGFFFGFDGGDFVEDIFSFDGFFHGFLSLELGVGFFIFDNFGALQIGVEGV